MLFIRGRSVAPDSSEAATGVSKSTKTILNKNHINVDSLLR